MRVNGLNVHRVWGVGLPAELNRTMNVIGVLGLCRV